jgi:hypothetical protein
MSRISTGFGLGLMLMDGAGIGLELLFGRLDKKKQDDQQAGHPARKYLLS